MPEHLRINFGLFAIRRQETVNHSNSGTFGKNPTGQPESLMQDLRPPALATLKEISGFPWFSRVGEWGSDVSTAVVLGNWYEAISSVEAGEWEELCMDAANGFSEQLAKVASSRFRTWNAKVEAIKKVSVPMISSLFSTRADLQPLPKVVQDSVQWDVLHVCLEAEFSDCLPPGFYASNSYWYRAGHFPCGWKGKFPDGRIIIY
jgi:hypothetical protein